MQADTPQRTLGSLQDYYAINRAMPSFGALAKLVGVSVSTVADAVAKLKLLGFLRASETGRLQPGRRFFERQLLGPVQAGQPAAAPELQAEGLLIDEYLIDAPTRTFLLTVRGESMRDAGLLPGDTVVVKRGSIPAVGDIVVAALRGEMTVKQLAQEEGGAPYLKARNPEFDDIYPAEDCEVIGVVVGQFRRYARTRHVSMHRA
jgi:SOS-response transcriptional repressor LexA